MDAVDLVDALSNDAMAWVSALTGRPTVQQTAAQATATAQLAQAKQSQSTLLEFAVIAMIGLYFITRK